MEPARSDVPTTSPDPAGETSNSKSSPIRAPARRQSSIRFADETSTVSRSSMSRGWRNTNHEEVTPIRNAEGVQGRNYNTSHAEEEEDHTPPSKPNPSGSSVNAAANADEDSEDRPPWYKRIAEKYGSVSLENKGSVARDHLALERTFLAWLRTSLAFASIGIAITQLFRLNTTIASRSQSYAPATVAVPFSPYLGQSLPVELLPYLQQAAATAASTFPSLGPTLLDQLLLLPPPGSPTANVPAPPIQDTAYNEHAAAKLRHVGKPLGATFLGISIVILFIGFHRYFEAQHWIIRGKFPASRGSIFIVGVIAGALIVASLVVVLVVAPTSFQTKT